MDQDFIHACQFYDIFDVYLQKKLFKIKKNLIPDNRMFDQDFDIYLMFICFPEVIKATKIEIKIF